MKYKIFKFVFTTDVHFGDHNLVDGDYALHADTLFSAMYIEAMKFGNRYAEQLYQSVINDELIFSDAFPYIAGQYYLPKPMKHIEREEAPSSVLRKKYKKLKYIPFEEFNSYLTGRMDIEKVTEKFHLGDSQMRVLAHVEGQKETVPYRVKTYHFAADAGLYIIVGYKTDEVNELVEMLLDSISYTGIGGRKSSGLGKYTLYTGKLPESITSRIENPQNCYMLLSVALPQEEELEQSLEGAEYLLTKRSGFVSSEEYNANKGFLRKKDLYVFTAGSCFESPFKGGIYDVSEPDKHPVYRYAKPMFMGV